MTEHRKLSDNDLVSQLHECVLDPSLFSHEAHVRLAWIHINRYGVQQAIENITSDLKRFVAHLGVEEKYSETLTVAAVKVIADFMKESSSRSFHEFIVDNPCLLNEFQNLLLKYCS